MLSDNFLEKTLTSYSDFRKETIRLIKISYELLKSWSSKSYEQYLCLYRELSDLEVYDITQEENIDREKLFIVLSHIMKTNEDSCSVLFHSVYVDSNLSSPDLAEIALLVSEKVSKGLEIFVSFKEFEEEIFIFAINPRLFSQIEEALWGN